MITLLNDGVGQVQYIVSAVITGIQQPLTLVGLAIAAMDESRTGLIGLLITPILYLPLSSWKTTQKSHTRRIAKSKCASNPCH